MMAKFLGRLRTTAQSTAMPKNERESPNPPAGAHPAPTREILVAKGRLVALSSPILDAGP
jgi:hypothetical protein